MSSLRGDTTDRSCGVTNQKYCVVPFIIRYARKLNGGIQYDFVEPVIILEGLSVGLSLGV